MSSCQKDVKLSKRCQKVKHMDYGGGSQKNKRDIKMGMNMCEPHYMNLFFCEPPP